MVYRPKDIQKTVKYAYATGIKKCEILNIDTQMVSMKDDTRPTLLQSQDMQHGSKSQLTLLQPIEPHTDTMG